jgi:hypothetical protein
MTEKLKDDKTAGTQVRAPCRECSRETNHLVVRAVQQQGEDEYQSIWWGTVYQIVQCQGCDAVGFRSVYSDSETVDPDGNVVQVIKFYPDPYAGRQAIGDAHLLPKDVKRIYEEALEAMNNGQPVLVGIAIRAIIETVCKAKNAPGSNLAQRIDGLVTLNLLAQGGATILHKLRVLGNNAAHEVKAHTTEELSLAMDVVDHLLATVYILPAQSEKTFGD